jgi:3-isopropylmalate/(R)-2-methylmalate dehydratase small subunit
MSSKQNTKIITSKVYVLGDNIDTDQIIPAQYLSLVPTKPAEYQKLGSYALSGLPGVDTPFMEKGQAKTDYHIIVAGRNFGCGSSREHAPIALGAAGVKAVVAFSFARILFRNSVATGELFPCETTKDIHQEFKTNDEAVLDLTEHYIINKTTGKKYNLKPMGAVAPVVEAGGLFEYARKAGMIKMGQ